MEGSRTGGYPAALRHGVPLGRSKLSLEMIILLVSAYRSGKAIGNRPKGCGSEAGDRSLVESGHPKPDWLVPGSGPIPRRPPDPGLNAVSVSGIMCPVRARAGRTGIQTSQVKARSRSST
ncbi:MAG: hypothetical protein LBR80_02865 [Deltaproteobacteria bacterium]|jgi:hypothetical protein|nr:hypothetical protein [Deltaproteobacteria bacterium]